MSNKVFIFSLFVFFSNALMANSGSLVVNSVIIKHNQECNRYKMFKYKKSGIDYVFCERHNKLLNSKQNFLYSSYNNSIKTKDYKLKIKFDNKNSIKRYLNSLHLFKKLFSFFKVDIILIGKYDEKSDLFLLSNWKLSLIKSQKIIIEAELNGLSVLFLRNISEGKIKSKEYLLDYLGTVTGQSDYIQRGKEYYGLNIYRAKSNKKAIAGFSCLRWQVLDANYNKKIRIVGFYDKETSLFVLQHWYLPAIFIELKEGKEWDTPRKKIKRKYLRRSDFLDNREWCKILDKNFNPRKHNYKFSSKRK